MQQLLSEGLEMQQGESVKFACFGAFSTGFLIVIASDVHSFQQH